jgi:ubiquinone/menaquinone biosynthesis C-methylase UbiE
MGTEAIRRLKETYLMKQHKDHYSYRYYADPKVAVNFDSDLFSGIIGEYIKDVQKQAVFSILGKVDGWKVIDVGAGTGRFSIPFHASGAEVVACDASAQMLEILRQKIEGSERSLHIVVGDAHDLQFSDQIFDCAVSFRTLIHVINWQRALFELCRVSRDWVVFDIAPRRGFLLLVPIIHRFRQFFVKGFQGYRTLPPEKIEAELQRNGFYIIGVDPGFFLPIVVHRLARSRKFTLGIERVFSRLGLTKRFGAPLTIFARRRR